MVKPINNVWKCLLMFLLLLSVLPPAFGTTPVEREVKFTGMGGVSLSGTLTLPLGIAPVAALVLIAGSGPTDRDGNQPPLLQTDLLKQIVADLAKQGIASLRYDKRGQYASGPLPISEQELYDFTAWHNYVGDVAAAYRWLRAQPGIRPSRVGLLGHSEGGLLALDAADTLRATPPAVLVLVSTQGRPTNEVLHEQIKRLLDMQGATPEQTKFFMDKNDSILAAIRRTGHVPEDVPPGLAFLYQPYLGKFLQEQLGLTPVKLLASFPGPVLILQGASDVQVSPSEDAGVLKSAKNEKGISPTLMLIKGASHNLKSVKGAQDAGFSGPIVPDALTALNGWLATYLVK